MQCPQCRQRNDHNARFCVQCGARVRAAVCASCGGTLPASARFCPGCGTAVPETMAPDVPQAAVQGVARVAPARDPAEALLSARGVDGVEDEPPTSDDEELLERVGLDHARRRGRRRSVIVAASAFLVLAAALVVAIRGPRAPQSATAPEAVPSSAPAPASETPRGAHAAAPAPRPTEASTDRAEPTRQRDAVEEPASELPSRGARTTASAEVPSVVEQRGAPAAMPSAAAPRPPMRVAVTQRPSGDGAVDYTVRVTRPDGTPVTGAAVRLRGVMNDGTVMEAPLEAGNEPGVYRSLLAFSPRGPRRLTLRVAGADGIFETPVADPAPGVPQAVSGEGSARP